MDCLVQLKVPAGYFSQSVTWYHKPHWGYTIFQRMIVTYLNGPLLAENRSNGQNKVCSLKVLTQWAIFLCAGSHM